MPEFQVGVTRIFTSVSPLSLWERGKGSRSLLVSRPEFDAGISGRCNSNIHLVSPRSLWERGKGSRSLLVSRPEFDAGISGRCNSNIHLVSPLSLWERVRVRGGLKLEYRPL
jgi:hypothetical protein